MKQVITRFFVSKPITLIALRLAGVSLLFLATLTMTNYYPIDLVGEFELTRTILLLLGAIVVAGTDRSIIQFAGRLESDGRFDTFLGVYLNSLKLIGLLCFIILLVYVLIPVEFYQNFFSDSIIFKIIISLFFYAGATLNTEVFRVFELNMWAELYRGIFKYILLFCAAIYLMNSSNQAFIIDVFLFSFVILFVVSTFQIVPKIKNQNWKSSFKTFAIYKVSMPMALTGLGFFLLLSIDVILLKYIEGNEAVAVYAQPVKIISLIAMVQTTLQASISKQLATCFFKKDYRALGQLIKKTTRTIAIISLPLVVILLFMPKFLLSLFGSNYVEGSMVLKVLLIGCVVNAICGCTSIYMDMTNKQAQFRNIIFITIFINIILNLILIPIYGIIGAAIASSFCLVFWNLAIVFHVYKKDNLNLVVH
ncbi:polysaccharide biosynthesis C-terminal domain-containing protein [Nonlabens sp. SCSIO 43208]|uniref:MATE family efflux transporter n=1 Tax=Nonlabens sp. SCSIO 43208 TaxID=2793009 RepID=UPI003D6B4FB6